MSSRQTKLLTPDETTFIWNEDRTWTRKKELEEDENLDEEEDENLDEEEDEYIKDEDEDIKDEDEDIKDGDEDIKDDDEDIKDEDQTILNSEIEEGDGEDEERALKTKIENMSPGAINELLSQMHLAECERNKENDSEPEFKDSSEGEKVNKNKIKTKDPSPKQEKKITVKPKKQSKKTNHETKSSSVEELKPKRGRNNKVEQKNENGTDDISHIQNLGEEKPQRAGRNKKQQPKEEEGAKNAPLMLKREDIVEDTSQGKKGKGKKQVSGESHEDLTASSKDTSPINNELKSKRTRKGKGEPEKEPSQGKPDKSAKDIKKKPTKLDATESENSRAEKGQPKLDSNSGRKGPKETEPKVVKPKPEKTVSANKENKKNNASELKENNDPINSTVKDQIPHERPKRNVGKKEYSETIKTSPSRPKREAKPKKVLQSHNADETETGNMINNAPEVKGKAKPQGKGKNAEVKGKEKTEEKTVEKKASRKKKN